LVAEHGTVKQPVSSKEERRRRMEAVACVRLYILYIGVYS